MNGPIGPLYDLGQAMNKTLLSERALLLLTRSAASAAMWNRDLRLHEVSSIIATYESRLPDNLETTFALAIVDAEDLDICQKSLDICRRLRMQTDNPILLLSDDVIEAHHFLAYEAGVDACIRKPIGVDLLLAKANAWLRFSSPEPADDERPVVNVF